MLVCGGRASGACSAGAAGRSRWGAGALVRGRGARTAPSPRGVVSWARGAASRLGACGRSGPRACAAGMDSRGCAGGRGTACDCCTVRSPGWERGLMSRARTSGRETSPARGATSATLPPLGGRCTTWPDATAGASGEPAPRSGRGAREASAPGAPLSRTLASACGARGATGSLRPAGATGASRGAR